MRSEFKWLIVVLVLALLVFMFGPAILMLVTGQTGHT